MPSRGGDEVIAKLGVYRIACPVPFPQAGGPVNAIVVEEEGGGIALFDTGIATEEGEEALVAGLAARGHSFADVKRIFITHGHVDHYGLAAKIRDASGCEIFVHPADRWKCAGPPPWEERAPATREFLRRCGADDESIEAMVAFASATDLMAPRILCEVGELYEGMRLRFARCEATLLHMPGHTPGLCCAMLQGEGPRVLLANDHLLEKVSPNPILELLDDGSRFRALPTYFRSLQRIHAAAPDWIVPGHGAIFDGWREVVAGLAAFYARRQQKVWDAIDDDGSTPVELVHRIFAEPNPFNLFLMVSEILGSLDLLEEAGRVRCEECERLVYRRL